MKREDNTEFNVFEHFKDYKRTTNGPMTPQEQGSSFFLSRMGQQIRAFAVGLAS